MKSTNDFSSYAIQKRTKRPIKNGGKLQIYLAIFWEDPMFRRTCSMNQSLIVGIEVSDVHRHLLLLLCILAILEASAMYH